MSAHKPIVLGQENLPASGAVIIPNRLTFQDILHLEKIITGRSLVYLLEQNAVIDPLLQAHLEKDSTEALLFSVGEQHLDAFKKALHGHITQEALIIFVPGDSLTRPGELTRVPSATTEFIISAGAPLVPLFIDHPQDTSLQIEPRRETDNLVFSFGKVLEREASNLANYQENLLVASNLAFESRPAFDKHLGYALLQGLKKHASVSKLIDGLDGSETRFHKILAVAIVFSKLIRQETSATRVGIVLPPGRAGMIANLAVIFAGKIPVNINFTAGPGAINSSIEQAGVDRLITVDRFIRKNQKFPWPPNKQLIFLERVLPPLKSKIALWMILAKLFSANTLARLLGIPKKADPTDEAILLFTSGSAGEPKGVPLTHRNILGNVNQFGARIDLHHYDKLLGCLPLFHSFGCTVTLWFPLIEGVDLVTYPSPLEVVKLAELIEKYEVTVLLATPTFLRGYLRRAEKKQLTSLDYTITGAEKLPPSLSDAYREKFGKPVLEGYGLTETSPVTNVNLPDPNPTGSLPLIPSTRTGSVGQLLPGMAIRITDPDTDEPLSLHKAGMIWLKGPNVFTGYLNNPDASAKILQKGWFKTGDLGRMDADGFLYIEGRLKRFSKIGGEMVPHETVEEAIVKQLGLESEAERKIVVTGCPDEAKGEALVLLSTLPDLDLTDLRYRLLEAGIPSLWVPKSVIDVDEIPVLASGKLDLQACDKVAKQPGSAQA
ncbi:MAG: AMP-binding protein [Verrucomicrobiota bacterium]